MVDQFVLGWCISIGFMIVLMIITYMGQSKDDDDDKSDKSPEKQSCAY